MKTPLFLWIRPAGIVTTLILALAAPLSAQKTAADAAAPLQKKADSPAAKAPGATCNLGMVVEIYSLDQADAAKLMEDNPGDGKFYVNVRELVARGEAKLETLLGSVTKSSGKSEVKQTINVPYATEFEARPPSGKEPVATAFETRDIGDSFHWDPELALDKSTCRIALEIAETRICGTDKCSYPNQPKTEFAQPRFESRTIAAKQNFVVGTAQFLGTLNFATDVKDGPVQKKEETPTPRQVHLAFGRVSLLSIPEKPLPPQSGTLEVRMSLYSMDREAAHTVLSELAAPGGAYRALQPLLERKAARLERILAARTVSGERVITQAVEEIRFLTGPANGSEAPGFEMKPTGLVLEAEPTLIPNTSTVDLVLAPNMVTMLGGQRGTPLFESRSVTSSLFVPLGEQVFLGTFSQPTNTGVRPENDSRRVWLGFLQANLPQP